MDENPSEETVVVATYSTRHDAEMAKSILEDNGISAFVVADDVHVPLQLTEGVRLIVLQSQVRRASEALEDLGLTPHTVRADGEKLSDAAERIDRPAKSSADPDNLFPDQDYLSDDYETGVNSPTPSSPDERRRSLQPRERAIVASTIAALLVVVLFFVPWRVEPNDEIVWAPFYRSPITHTTTFEEPGVTRINYEAGEVAFGILLLQVLGVVAVGGISFVLIPGERT